jgi:hypothetical protein
VLVMSLRLGLRASEAAALALEAEVTVHGKGSRAERFPQAGRRRWEIIRCCFWSG